jgi:hypothetical protein
MRRKIIRASNNGMVTELKRNQAISQRHVLIFTISNKKISQRNKETPASTPPTLV